METISELAKKIGLACEWELVEENPYISDMPRGSSHYLVTLLRKSGQKMSIHFSMGPLHGLITRGPSALEVLDCVVMDARGFKFASCFEEWAEDYGYDTDSRKAYKTWEVIGRNCAELEEFLGEEFELALEVEGL